MSQFQIEEEIEAIESAMASPDLCKGTAETYARISGYARPLRQWNKGKTQEYKERLPYKI